MREIWLGQYRTGGRLDGHRTGHWPNTGSTTRWAWRGGAEGWLRRCPRPAERSIGWMAGATKNICTTLREGHAPRWALCARVRLCM